MTLRFIHASGQHGVSNDLRQLLSTGTRRLRLAVSYFTGAGLQLLEPHVDLLKSDGSFIVVNLEAPTDFEALEELHALAPGKLYVHLGSVVPREIKVGVGIMHSKIILAEDDATSRLWVGSHNFTARALAGANFEAALTLEGHTDDPVILEAGQHLEACRSASQPFDPVEHGPGPDGIDEDEVLVLLAEAEEYPTAVPFATHLRIFHTGLDRHLILNRRVHLYLFPTDYLSASPSVDFRDARLWDGSVTGGNQTEQNPYNPGVAAGLDRAPYRIDIQDIPRFRKNTGDDKTPDTQGVIRLKMELRPGYDIYSLTHRRITASSTWTSGEEHLLDAVPRSLLPFFTSESVRGTRLVYRPKVHREATLGVTTFEPEVPKALLDHWKEALRSPHLHLEATFRRPPRAAERFFFVAKRHVDLRR